MAPKRFVTASHSTLLFRNIALRSATGEKETRMDGFNALYAFSRSMFTTVLTGTTALLIQNHSDWRYYVISTMIFVIWLRS